MPTSRPPLSPETLNRLRSLILNRKPWRQSTGPRSAAGKSRCRGNALKHGFYSSAALQARRMLRGLEQTTL